MTGSFLVSGAYKPSLKVELSSQKLYDSLDAAGS